MSKTKIITITCWIISALALIGLAIWLLVSSLSGAAFSAFSGNFSLGINLSGTENLTGVFDIQGTYTADVADINSIKINWVAGDITVTPYNGDVVQITESAQRQLQDNERFFMNTSGSTLNIRFTEKNRIRRMPQKRLEILVPQGLSDSLQLLDISSVSSKINVKDSQAASLDFNSVSGAIEISDISSDSIKLNSTSGAMYLENVISGRIKLNSTSGATNSMSVRAGKLDISSVSGVMVISDSIITELDISTTSGRKTISGEFDRVKSSSVSGATIITSTIIPSRMDLNSTSGAFEVYLPNEGDISVSHSAVSGRFSSELPVTMQKDAAFRFSTVSGNTSIYVLEE